MISYLEKLTDKELASLPQNSIKTRIIAMYDAYGSNLSFLDFWLQRDDGMVTAALCRFAGELWLLADRNADFEELAEFSRAIAPIVLTDVGAANRLGFEKKNEFWELSVRFEKGESPATAPDISMLYDVLMQGADGDIEIPDKKEWYADISHRFRHGTAVAVLNEDSAALAGFVTKDSALITGVATRPSARGIGKGAATVKELCTALADKTVYAEATQKTVSFYEKSGFAISSALCRCYSTGGKRDE